MKTYRASLMLWRALTSLSLFAAASLSPLVPMAGALVRFDGPVPGQRLSVTQERASIALKSAAVPGDVRTSSVGLTFRLGTFTGIGSEGEREPPELRFREALKRALLRVDPAIQFTEDRRRASDGIVSGQVCHVNGPDTPYLIQVFLFQDRNGKPGSLQGIWSGSAASIFLFSDRMQRPDVHPGGIAGDIAERLIEAAQPNGRSIADALSGLHPGSLRVVMESGSRKETAIRDGGSVEGTRGENLRLRAELRGAKSVTVLARDRSGRWYGLFLPEREVGAFADGAVSVPLRLPGAAAGESLTVWVVAGLQDEWTKPLPGRRTRTELRLPTGAGRADTPVQVLSGMGASRSEPAWGDNPVLRSLAEPGAEARFAALRFTLRLL